jgi:dienelactone hydrolase
MDECCTRGHIHEGTPTGTIIQIAGKDAYFAKAKNFTGRAVLLLTDALGIKFINSKLLADTYAEQANVNVYVPDQFNNDEVPLEVLTGLQFDIMAWVGTQDRPGTIEQNKRVAKELREKHGVTKLAAIGFCWGGFSTFALGATDLVDACAVAHPSLTDFPKDIHNLKKPTLFLMAETDAQFGQEKQEQAKEILKSRNEEYKFVFYPGTTHGFATRSDLKDQVEGKAAEDAKDKAVEFFNKYL